MDFYITLAKGTSIIDLQFTPFLQWDSGDNDMNIILIFASNEAKTG
ncbi:MAG: hypothetical protein GY928_09550 [Colwellia sp.]|nr:hypothetical protein [Colwellia sp.]